MLVFLILALFAPLYASAQPQMLWSTPYGGRQLAFAPDGRTVLSVGSSGLSAVDVATGKRLYDLHESLVNPITFSNDGTSFIGGNTTVGRFDRYDTRTGRLIQSSRAGVTLSGKKVISGDRNWMCTWDNTSVAIWDLRSLDTVMTLKHNGNINNGIAEVAISHNGASIALAYSGIAGMPAAIWRVGVYEARVTVGEGEISSVFSRTGDTLFTATSNGLLTMWNVNTGKRLRQTYWSLNSGGGSSLAIDPSGSILMSGTSALATKDLAYITTFPRMPWFTNDGDSVRVLLNEGVLVTYVIPTLHLMHENAIGFDEQTIEESAISQDGEVLALRTTTGYVLTSKWRTGEIDTVLGPVKQSVFAIQPGADIIVGKANETYTAWDIETGKARNLFERPGPFSAIQVTDSKIWIALNDTIEVWSLKSGTMVLRSVLDSTFHSTPICLPGSERIIGSFTDGTLRLVDLRSGQEVWSIPRPDGNYEEYISSPSERMFAVAIFDSVHRMYIYATADGTLLQTLILKRDAVGVQALFHPDDKRIIVATTTRDPNIKVWSIETGDSLVAMRPEQRWIDAPTLLPDEQHLLTTDWHTTVSRWNLETGQLLRSITLDSIFTIEQDPRLVIDAAASQLVVGARQGTKVYDLSNDTVIASLPSVEPRAFDRTGRFLVSTRGSSTPGSYVGSLQVWDVKGLTVSVNDEKTRSQHGDLVVSPNPVSSIATATVTFSSTTHQTLTICDLTGRIHQTFTGSGSLEPQYFELNSANLPNGALFIRASDSTHHTTTFIILAD